jgi:stress-induced morphogen
MTQRPLRGAAAAIAGFDYQLDVSVFAALQLMLISKATTRLILEPANDEDLEADLKPNVPGRMQPSASMAGGYKLVIQIKRRTGEPWSAEDFEALLNHGSSKTNGRRKALHHLDDPTTRYLLVTSADAKGVARDLLVKGFEEISDKTRFPASLARTLKKSPEGRVAIWGGLTEEQLASDLRALLTDLLHVPEPQRGQLLDKLRNEARRRTRGSTPGIWGYDDLYATVRAFGGFLASSARLEQFVPPANFDAMIEKLSTKHAVVLRGPSGTGKTEAAAKLCDLARQANGALTVVLLGADDLPTQTRIIVDTGPKLFYLDDPWGQYSLSGSSEAWTAQLPRLLGSASKNHQFVITSRSDMLTNARVGNKLDRWSVELSPDEYRGGRLLAIHNNFMDELPPELQSKAHAFRGDALAKLSTPLEIRLYFDHLQDGPELDEPDHAFFQRLLKLAQREAVEDVVVEALRVSDTNGTAAVTWALLTALGQFDLSQMVPLQRALRTRDTAIGEGLSTVVNRMVASAHLRQPARTVSFSHPSVRQGFDTYVRTHWLRSEAALATLISALTSLPDAQRAWGLDTATLVLDAIRRFVAQQDIDPPFEADADSQAAVDGWLGERLLDPNSKAFAKFLELASDVGSDASVPSRVARFLLKGTQRGASFFIRNWAPPQFDEDWYAAVAADPIGARVAERFVREELGYDRGSYGTGFAARLDRIAPNLTPAYLDAARKMIGNGFEMNADAVAAGAIRDLDGYELVLRAALDDLESLRRRDAHSFPEEWRAIEDGERDHAAEEAMQWNHQDDGYTSGVFIDAYISRLRELGRWRDIRDHPRVADLVQSWAHAIETVAAAPDELHALLTASHASDFETYAWSAARKSWDASLDALLEARINMPIANPNLRQELALCGAAAARNTLLAAFETRAGNAASLVTLLTDLHRSHPRLPPKLRKKLVARLSPELIQISAAMAVGKKPAGVLAGAALALIEESALSLDPDSMAVILPILAASGADTRRAIARWLTIAESKAHSLAAAEAAIANGDKALVEQALRHPRADARRAALLHVAPTLPDPLSSDILGMAADPGNRVRRALVSILEKRPHPDHLKALLPLLHDRWSSAEPQHDEPESFDVAQDAILAIAANAPLSDTIGDALLDLANTTTDRLLSKYALIVAAHACSPGIQQKMSNLVNIPEARWIRLDALNALANADEVAPAIIDQLTASFILRTPAILAVPATHLVATHAPVASALKLFKRIADSNNRRALLLVAATAIAPRDSAVAGRILDLLEPGHPARELLGASAPLALSILNDLGTVELREHVRKYLGDRLVSA